MNTPKTLSHAEILESIAKAKDEKDLLNALVASDNLPCRKEQKEINMLVVDMIEDLDKSTINGTKFNPEAIMQERGIILDKQYTQMSWADKVKATLKSLSEGFANKMTPVPMSEEFDKSRLSSTFDRQKD